MNRTDSMNRTNEKIPDLRALYIAQLRRLLSAEGMMRRGLSKKIEYASNPELRQALESNGREIEFRLERLQTILKRMTGEAEERIAESTRAAIGEGEEMAGSSPEGTVRDVALLISELRLHHDEIAAYGSVVHLARLLEIEWDEENLHSSLHEEQKSAHLLETIFEHVNPLAQKAA